MDEEEKEKWDEGLKACNSSPLEMLTFFLACPDLIDEYGLKENKTKENYLYKIFLEASLQFKKSTSKD